MYSTAIFGEFFVLNEGGGFLSTFRHLQNGSQSTPMHGEEAWMPVQTAAELNIMQEDANFTMDAFNPNSMQMAPSGNTLLAVRAPGQAHAVVALFQRDLVSGAYSFGTLQRQMIRVPTATFALISPDEQVLVIGLMSAIQVFKVIGAPQSRRLSATPPQVFSSFVPGLSGIAGTAAGEHGGCFSSDGR